MKTMTLNEPFYKEPSNATEKSVLIESLKRYRSIAKLNANLAPKFILAVVSTIKSKHRGISTKIIFNMLIPKLAQAITFYRIQYQENERMKPDYPNWYSINIAKSGFGKDRIMKEINEYLFQVFTGHLILK